MIKKTSFTVLLILMLTGVTFSQRNAFKDSIEMVGNWFNGYKFYQYDHELKMRKLGIVMHGNPEALKFLNKAKNNNILGFVTGFIGGFCIGYEAGNLLSGAKVHWPVMAVGAGLIGITVPIYSGVRRNAKMAVTIFNAAYR